MAIDADGIENPGGKVFNKTYPGPWIREFPLTPRSLFPNTYHIPTEACWGDEIGMDTLQTPVKKCYLTLIRGYRQKQPSI